MSIRAKKIKRLESINNIRADGGREMFPIKRIEKIQQELNYYYLQILAFQDKDSQYQDILTKFSKNLIELENIIEDMRKYNNNKNTQLINLYK